MTSLHTTTLHSVKPSDVSWLWPGRIPRGKVTLLAGDPGLGKSFVTMDLAARVSRAGAWPDGPTTLRQPGSVLILSAEDDPADTIRPRIEAGGGDLSRVQVVESVRAADGRELGLDLSVDVTLLARHLETVERPRLIVIDPISAYLGNVDSHNNAQVRGVLASLARLAMKHGPAIVCVTHLNKNPGGKAVYRTTGSLAFTAAARVVWQITRLPGGTGGGDENARAMLLVKSNLATTRTGLAFTIETEPGTRDPKVRWAPTPLHLDADAVEEAAAPDEATALPEAVEFLRSYLSDGPMHASEITEIAQRAGISIGTLKRAKPVVGVRTRRAPGGGRDRPWVWAIE
jgi:hypothetical protein